MQVVESSTNVVEMILAEEPYLHRLSKFFLRNRKDDAEDLVQITLMNAYRARNRFRPDASMKSWLGSIMKNEFLSFIRNRKVRKGTLPIEYDDEKDEISAKPEGSLDLDLVSTLENLDDKVKKALMSLSEEQFTAFYLHVVVEYSCEEIAEMVSCRPCTVMTRCHRAKERVRQSLGL